MNLPPPESSLRFRAQDLAQSHALMTRFDGPHERRGRGGARIGLEMRLLPGSDLDIGWLSFEGFHVARGEPALPTVHIPLLGRFTYSSAGRAFDAGPGAFVLLEPGESVTLAGEGGLLLSVWLRRSPFGKEGTVWRRPEVADRTAAATEVPLVGDQRAEVAAALRRLVRARGPVCADRDEAVASEQALGTVFSWVISAEREGSAEKERMKAAELWVDAHRSEPLSVCRLAEVAGLAERTLRRRFVERRGVSPAAFVASRRLAAVRVRLSWPEPEETVTRVAFDCGFVHLGRFAGLYRRAYGESPLRTLRRSVDAAPGAPRSGGRLSFPVGAGPWWPIADSQGAERSARTRGA